VRWHPPPIQFRGGGWMGWGGGGVCRPWVPNQPPARHYARMGGYGRCAVALGCCVVGRPRASPMGDPECRRCHFANRLAGARSRRAPGIPHPMGRTFIWSLISSYCDASSGLAEKFASSVKHFGSVGQSVALSPDPKALNPSIFGISPLPPRFVLSFADLRLQRPPWPVFPGDADRHRLLPPHLGLL